MLIFRPIIWIAICGLAFSQRVDSTLYADLKIKGEWKSYYLLNEQATYDFISELSEIDSIHFSGDQSVEQKVLRHLFQPLMGLSDQNRALVQFRTIQSAYSFLNDQSDISFAQFGQKQVAAVVDFHPQFKSQIGGILGASKGKDGKWITTGEVDLHLENPRGQGTIMDLEWRQPNARSRFLNFAYEVLFPFGLPFGTGVEFLQDFMEDSYILETTSGMATGIGPLGRWMIGGKKESSRDLVNETKFDSESVILGLRGDHRNNRWLPYRGHYWEGEINLGRWDDELGNTRVIEGKFRIDRFKPMNFGVLYLSVRGHRAWVADRELTPAKKVKFGGAGSLRGYHENQFSADWVVLHNTEWIFGDLDRSQMFVFVDFPVADRLRIKPGYGLGFRQYNGTISLDIAAGFSEGSSGAKIHLKFSSDL